MNDSTSPAWQTSAASSLAGRAALVTGSGVGIGRATVLQMAAAGAFVGIHCRQSRAEAEQTLADVQALGGNGVVLQADLADPTQGQRLVDEFVAAAGRLDILVNNAGSPVGRVKLEECSLELWQEVIATNLTGSFAVTQRAIPHLRKSGKGAIVNNLTLSIQTGGANGAGPYAAAKGGLQVMTRTLARELAPEVRTNAVMPGVIETRHHEQFSTPERMAQYRKETPLGRNGSAEEVAAAITFLASDAASFINGALLDISGGRFLR
jgi:3-oxoacyl-[acyl-carrier protein] reductase